jgi:filamentous hemagglutinin
MIVVQFWRFSTACYTSSDLFNPQGLQVTPELMQTQQAQAIISQYVASGSSLDDAYRYASNLINTGTSLPEIVPIGSDTELIKVVPKNASGGDGIGNYSPFFMTREQYDSIANLPANEIANYLGLPAEQGIRGSQIGFDVYSMKPLPGTSPTVFSSEVAPIQQGGYSASGGAEQILVPNRSLWTDPNVNKIGEIGGRGNE